MPDKLSRLLATETELDEMLEQTRREAAQVVADAHADAEKRIRLFEAELEAAERALRDRVDSERDDAIATVRSEARRVVGELDGLGADRVEALAEYVVERLIGTGGAS